VAILILAAQLVACGTVDTPPPVETDPGPVADPMTVEPPAADQVPDVPPGAPDGPPDPGSPAEWEHLSQRALGELAAGHLDAAGDLVFQLQDIADAPGPADATAGQLEHRRSIRRRAGLLAGVLAEMRAFSVDTANPDSVLAAEYLVARGAGLPDSLLPATGTELPPLQADLLKVRHEKVDRWVDYFTGRGRRNYQIWLDRLASVGPVLEPILVDEDLPRELVFLAMIESGLSTRARSPVGAVGPWQFMAPTARAHGLTVNWWLDERRDLELSTRAACSYLKALHAEFGDWALVLAGYNSGEGRVRRQLRERGHDNFWDYRLPRQTLEYVPKFIAAARIGADPAAYGFTSREPEPWRTELLTVDEATDLALVASCADVEETTVYTLNPGLLRRATPPGLDAFPVRVPAGTADRARRALARIPPAQRLTWRKHEVERGETLGHIAARWGTSVRAVQEANGLGRRTLIHPGDQLLIPMPRELSDLARARVAAAGRYVPPDGHERVTYLVRPGDTLGAIARRLGVSVKHLARVNGIDDPRRLRVGRTLEAYRPPSRS
jgi:LysM repeat protein